MRGLFAIAELRLRGATAARLPWLVPCAFAAGLAVARWAPGTDLHARAAAADALALSVCAALALLAVLVLAATTFAGEIRSAIADTLLSTPVSRGALVVGGAAGQTCFGFLLALALGAAAALGLDAAGLGATARGAVREFAPAAVGRPDVDGNAADANAFDGAGLAILGRDHTHVTARFVVPDPLPEVLVVRFSPRAQVESDASPAGTIEVAVESDGPRDAARDRSWRRVAYRAGRTFDATLASDGLRPGESARVLLRRIDGGWRLRFGEGSIQVGGARQLFGWNVVKAALCLLPLLAIAAAAGGAASARLGAAASLVLVLFLLLLAAGRDDLLDAAAFVVEEGEAQASGRHEELPGHQHDHTVEVSALQDLALARGAQVGLRAVPDASAFWRFGDLADGRAVTRSDLGRAAGAGVLPCVLLLGASWFLVRRRELQAG